MNIVQCDISYRKIITLVSQSNEACEGKHKQTILVPIVSLEEARKYNPSFGSTIASIRKDGGIGNYRPDPSFE